MRNRKTATTLAELNEAYQVLRDPKRRLHHLLRAPRIRQRRRRRSHPTSAGGTLSDDCGPDP